MSPMRPIWAIPSVLRPVAVTHGYIRPVGPGARAQRHVNGFIVAMLLPVIRCFGVEWLLLARFSAEACLECREWTVPTACKWIHRRPKMRRASEHKHTAVFVNIGEVWQTCLTFKSKMHRIQSEV